MRKIPRTMATQHPDNASGGFVSSADEIGEAVECLKNLNVDEFMWDWEGKFTDEAVVDRFLHNHNQYFKKQQLGKDKFLTFRIPNIWQEKGYSLIRSLLVILTSEDFARDLKLHTPPLFEVILPMTEKAEQLIFIQKAFREFAKFKTRTFNHKLNSDYLRVIPLLEGVSDQVRSLDLLRRYLTLHERFFGRQPDYLRVFIARSDPAMMSGMVANVLANKIMLSDLAEFSVKHKLKIYPIIGVGSLPFRGGFNPRSIRKFFTEYQGVCTATVQSGFRYDYPKPEAAAAIRLAHRLPQANARQIGPAERKTLKKIIRRFEASYQATLTKIVGDLNYLFAAFPRRRERRLHIGLLSYGRKLGSINLPRAITFTGSFYSIGVPPEFIGVGRVLRDLSQKEFELLQRHYVYFKQDLEQAGKFLNMKNLKQLSKSNARWRQVLQDVKLAETHLGLKLGPRTAKEIKHRKLAAEIWKHKRNKSLVHELIKQSGRLRQSLG
ncbi:MAG: phosphoenolpyruvate carboxylase [Candidatus Doudnabacteria bacterium]|nr:phosphoenolpyruvate carboxylase [Candidatus Doudnabacteria bacterium]